MKAVPDMYTDVATSLDKTRSDPKLCGDCVVAAVVGEEFMETLRAAGLDVENFTRFDCFAGSVSADTRCIAQGFGAHAVVLRHKGLTADGRKGELRVLPRVDAAQPAPAAWTDQYMP